METFMPQEGFVTQKGFVRRDPYGRVYIDRCATDEEHLLRPLLPGQERRDTCRFYLDELVPVAFDGDQVYIEIDIRITPCTGAADV